MQWRNMENVRSLPENPVGYIVSIELFFDGEWIRTDYVVRQNGGGICEPVLEAIANGEFSGEISAWSPPPPPVVLPYAGKYSKSRLIAAMTPTEFSAWMAALNALDPQPRQIYEQAAELERDEAGLFDGMVSTMIATWGEARVDELMAVARK